jgi:hypothetical protein
VLTVYRRQALVFALLIAVLVPATAAQARPIATGGPASQAAKARKKKPKVVKCKRGQVKVKTQGKTRCRPLRKALPRPKRGDLRLIVARAALAGDLSALRDRRGRRGASTRKILNQVNRRAYPGMQRAVPDALARLDRLSLRAGSARAHAHAAASDTYSFDAGGGVQIDVRLSLARQATAEFRLNTAGGGTGFRTTIGFNIDSGFKSKGCPEADGVLDAKDGLHVRVTTEKLEDNKVVELYGIDIETKTTMKGHNAIDAKLDDIDPLKDVQKIREISNGPDVGRIDVRAEITRQTKVNMRNGQYDAGRSSVTSSVRLSGLTRLLQAFFSSGVQARLQKAADEGFAATVQKAIDKYRALETAWNNPNTCVEAVFDPASFTKVLKKGSNGQFSAKLALKSGTGGNPPGRWTLTTQLGGTTSPGSAQGATPQFTYTVPAQPLASLFIALFKVTSKGGVAQGGWQQNIEGARLAQIAGSFNGSMTEYPGTQYSWAGNITFVPGGQLPGIEGGYNVSSGTYTVTVSGPSSSGCDVNGSRDVTIPAGGGGITVTATGPDGTGPYDYRINVPSPHPASDIDATRSNCADSNLNGTHQTVFTPQPIDSTESTQTSQDGRTYDGTSADNSGAPNFSISWHWSLQGT